MDLDGDGRISGFELDAYQVFSSLIQNHSFINTDFLSRIKLYI